MGWQQLGRTSGQIQRVEALLARRRQLQANELFPAAMQMDCPQDGCVGLGYLGFDTIMCFMCEHQWVPEDGGGDAPQTDAEHVMGLEVKRCPRCNEYIEKNGGCDHMTCRCRHEFYWTTLKPYRFAHHMEGQHQRERGVDAHPREGQHVGGPCLA